MFIVEPAVDDDLARAVITKKQSILLQKLCPTPGLVLGAQGISQSKVFMCWICRYYVKDQLSDCYKALEVVGVSDFRPKPMSYSLNFGSKALVLGFKV